MELETLIIADAVSTPPDDKFYVHGGGISRLEVPVLPFPIPIGVLLRLKLDDEDLRRSHHFRVALIGPLGVPNVPTIEFDASPPDKEPAPLAEGEERFSHIAIQINAVAVNSGLYRLEVHIDGELVRSVPIPVVLMSGPVQAPVEREWPHGAEAIAQPARTKRKRPPPKQPPTTRKPRRR